VNSINGEILLSEIVTPKKDISYSVVILGSYLDASYPIGISIYEDDSEPPSSPQSIKVRAIHASLGIL
jgi:hypothetical protein